MKSLTNAKMYVTNSARNNCDTKRQDMVNQTVLEGVISIQAAIEAESRMLECIWIQHKYNKRNRALAYLIHLAAERGLPIEKRDRAEISQVAGGQSHGGVIALAGPRHFEPLEALVTKSSVPFIVMLDGIEDPFNFGHAVRALYAAGADGLVVRQRNWLSAVGTVARASAGTSERIPTAVVNSVEEAAEVVRPFGLQVACTAARGAVDIYAADLAVPLFLVIGGERRGITRSFQDAADLVLQIPYGRSFRHSMGTTAAAAVVAFEVMRQRRARLS